MKNRLCEVLGVRYPIIQGGMAWSTDATLAAAVSNGGAAGIIGTGGRPTEWVEEEIKKAKTLTDRPFGINLMLMAPNVLREAYPIPVLAAGGISDGRAMAAALLMGADGVQMGTRFLLTTECPVHEKTKEMILNATDTDCVVTGYSRNMGVRCLANDFTRQYLEAEISGAPKETLLAMGTGRSRKGMQEGDIVNGSVMAGESLNVLTDILPCKEVIERIIRDANAALARAESLML